MNTCFFCGCPQGLRVKFKKVVVEKRLVLTDIIQKEDPKTHLIRVYSEGREEIVKEESACPVCVAKPHIPQIVEVRDESGLAKLVFSKAKT